MTRRFCIAVLMVILGATYGVAQQRAGGGVPDELLAVWSGSWEGMGAGGGFELTLEKGTDGATGRVSVSGEPSYKATLRALAYDAATKKLTAAYDFPPDDTLEVILVATFEGNTAKGAWTARPKAGGSELASGTWTVTKK